MIKKRIIIRGGKVHDVGYRLYLLDKAEALVIPNIGAWNLHEDGKEIVEVLVGADKEKVDKFITFVMKNFPEEAKVEGIPIVEEYKGDIPTIEAFSRSFSTSQLTKIAKVGVGMLKRQDQTIESINNLDKNMTERFDRMDTKYDKMSEKMDNIDKTLNRLVDVISSKKSI